MIILNAPSLVAIRVITRVKQDMIIFARFITEQENHITDRSKKLTTRNVKFAIGIKHLAIDIEKFQVSDIQKITSSSCVLIVIG